LSAEPAAKEIAFVPGWPVGILADEEANEEVELYVCCGCVEVEGLAHVVLRRVVGRLSPVDIGPAPVNRIGSIGF